MKPVAIVDPHPRSLQLLFGEAELARLKNLVSLVVHEDGRMPAEMVEQHLPQAVAVIGQTDLPGERLALAPNLRTIINVEGNFQPNVDYDTCFQRGIHVLGTGVAFGKAVAEMALGLALALARGIPEADRLFREGKEVYGRPSNQQAFLLSGCDVGFIGFGNLGRALLPLLAPLRCRVRVYDPWLPPGWLAEQGMLPCELDELLRASKVVFVLAGATADNQAMLNRAKLDLMPSGACLVLVSRAAVVDFEALTDKIAAGHIRAAIDTFPQEPFDPAHRLRKLDGVILSAHRAGGLAPVYRLMGQMIVDDLENILRGLAPVRLQRAERETVGRFRSMAVKR